MISRFLSSFMLTPLLYSVSLLWTTTSWFLFLINSLIYLSFPLNQFSLLVSLLFRSLFLRSSSSYFALACSASSFFLSPSSSSYFSSWTISSNTSSREDSLVVCFRSSSPLTLKESLNASSDLAVEQTLFSNLEFSFSLFLISLSSCFPLRMDWSSCCLASKTMSSYLFFSSFTDLVCAYLPLSSAFFFSFRPRSSAFSFLSCSIYLFLTSVILLRALLVLTPSSVSELTRSAFLFMVSTSSFRSWISELLMAVFMLWSLSSLSLSSMSNSYFPSRFSTCAVRLMYSFSNCRRSQRSFLSLRIRVSLDSGSTLEFSGFL